MAGKKKYSNEEGVWRTIGGRRVFIRTGQKLSDAMRESGKFKTGTRREVQEAKAEKRVDKLGRANTELYRKHGGFPTDTGNKEKNKVIDKAHRQWLDNAKEANDLNGIYKFGGYDNPKESDKVYDLVGQHMDEKQYMDNLHRIYPKKEGYSVKAGNPIEDLAGQRVHDVEETLNNDKILLNYAKEKKLNGIGGSSIEELENTISQKEKYISVAKGKEKLAPIDPYDFKEEAERIVGGNEAYKPQRAFESYYDKMRSHTDADRWTGKEYTNDEFMEHLTDSNWHSERRALEDAGLTSQELEYIKDKTTLSKWSVGEELTGKENTQKMIDEAKAKFRGNDYGYDEDFKSDRLKYVQENDKKMLEDYNKAKSMGMSEEKATITALTKRAKESEWKKEPYNSKAYAKELSQVYNAEEEYDDKITPKYIQDIDAGRYGNMSDADAIKNWLDGGADIIYVDDAEKKLKEWGVKVKNDDPYETYKNELTKQLLPIYKEDKRVLGLKQRFQGTYEDLKDNTNMSEAEILEFLKKLQNK